MYVHKVTRVEAGPPVFVRDAEYKLYFYDDEGYVTKCIAPGLWASVDLVCESECD